MPSWDENGKLISSAGPKAWDEHGNPVASVPDTRGLAPGQTAPPGVPKAPIAPGLTGPIQPTMGQQAKQAASGLFQGFVSDTANGVASAVAHPIDTLKSIPRTMGAYADRAADDLNKGHYADAAQHAFGVVPIIGPITNDFLDSTSGPTPDYQEAGRSIGNIAAMKAVPEVTGAVGKALKSGAEPLMENGLGIRNVDRAHAKAPGRAALDFTTGVRPETVAKSAGDAIESQAKTRNAAITNSTARGSLTPARAAVTDAMTRAAAGNSDTSHLTPMMEQLENPKPGFTGSLNPRVMGRGPLTIADLQDPDTLLKMRQRFGEDFTKFDTARPLAKEALRVGNQAYGALTNELHRVVPESVEPDRIISNLIPARDSAAAKSLNAGTGQRALGRFAAHTGALTGAALGYHQYGVPGMAAGLLLPELISSPTAQISAARLADTTGGLVRRARAATAALPAIGRNQ